MIFTISKASDNKKPCENAYSGIVNLNELVWKIEIKTIEELVKLAEEVEKPIIIHCHNIVPDIQIYDDNIE